MADDECFGCMCCAGAGNVSRDEHDAIRAKLAEAELDITRVTDERNALRSALTDSQEAVVASMRERLARYEAVVEAARQWAEQDALYHGHAGLKHNALAALRALDDSGGSGAAQAGGQSPPPARATGEQAQSQGRQLGATQRAAGTNDEPPLKELRSAAHRLACEKAAEQLALDDSPVGVAATAEAAPRWLRFNDQTGALWGGNLHPDRCVCQGDDPTPHKHYDDEPHDCARCACEAYRAALPEPAAKPPKPDPQAPATRADVAAMIAEERERVLRVVDAYREDSAGDAGDAQLLLGDIVDALRKAGKP